MRGPVHDLAVPPPIQLPANDLGKVAEVSQSGWAPEPTWETWM